jgi:uncharacterized membrane protein (DUF373 family)
MEKILKLFEKYVSWALIILAMIYVCYQVIDMVYSFAGKMASNFQTRTFEMEEKGKPIGGIFFSILLTLEIIQTVSVFARETIVKVRIILIVGLIAITRKILIEDMNQANANEEFAIAALILSLSLGYFLVNRSEKQK